ncbi:alpha/beta fold hydrolase [Halorussus sp. MSC15.2]|uniref:alpha/beta fold hydrolase n=1 Tax=Halorussus sp. MSC15.2 TaxID=2283638 RepID=UPI0013CFA794|nr:alpha/beta hydrolase [Halorussus sp. MSC15.2]NEU57769.1 alpha/beta hydrolase [Halorussus sp. MSC15.2]
MPGHEEWSDRQEATTVSVDGHELEVAYYDSESGGASESPSGERREDDRPSVVFVHGIPTWSFLWRDVVPAVAEDRRVIAPDLLGYGNSAMHDGFDRSIRAQEAMLDDLLDRLRVETVSLVAHDIGGGVALRYASHNPDAVEQLVLSNAVCYDSWPVEFVNELGLPSVAEETTDEELDAKLDFAFADGLYDDEGHEEFVTGMKAPWQSEEGKLSLSRNAVATNTNHTTELDYGAITAETLLLWGGDDVLQPVSYAERLADDIQDAELSVLDRAYHWVVEDRPDAYRERLRSFLSEGEAS